MREMQVRETSRRGFLKQTAAIGAGAAWVLGTGAAYAREAGPLRIGLIGCGRRGVGAVHDAFEASDSVVLAALGDLFPDAVATAREKLAPRGARVQLTDETCFVGWDAYAKVIAAEVDVVFLCAPPGFRPEHFTAAVAADKHVFMEKPAAVDAAGLRKILDAAAASRAKGLTVVAGTQRRHQAPYRDIMARLRDGAIGELVGGAFYWIGDYGYYPAVPRRPEWSDMEYQLRNWNYYAWLSGDHIVEQHVHNLDIMHWAFGAPPVKCFALGGRSQRTGAEFGHIYDHFSVEFEYANGARVQSLCRQNSDTFSRVAEHVAGTLGMSDCRKTITGPHAYEYAGQPGNPYVDEHRHLFASIENNEGLNEAEQLAISTAAAIMGRMSAYSGQEVSFDFLMKESKENLMPETLEFGPIATPPVAVPGVTPLV